MNNVGFEQALAGRVDEMLDACTKCGACFTACPITGGAGIADADPATVVSGVLDIVRLGAGPEVSEPGRFSGNCQVRSGSESFMRRAAAMERHAAVPAGHYVQSSRHHRLAGGSAGASACYIRRGGTL